MNHVKIGPSFFAKELNEYADWVWAFVREAAQNGMDAAGSTKLAFTTRALDGATEVAFENDGVPMDETVLVEKFLSIGESGKGFAGTVGGFGKAKLLLAFSHESYEIRTGTVRATGAGGEYQIERDLPYFHGTRTTVRIAKEVGERLEREVNRFASLAQWRGTLTLNGVILETNLRTYRANRELEFGTAYVNKSFSNRLVVRIGGIPMFSSYLDYKHGVIVELSGSSPERLAANRDSLKYPYSSQLSAFLQEIAVDKRSALRPRVATYDHYSGSKLSFNKPVEASPVAAKTTAESVVRPTAVESRTGSRQQTVGVREVGTSIGPDFVLRNETGMKIPDYYRPESFSFYAARLTQIWMHCLLELHRCCERDGSFSVGFVFGEAEALCEPNSPYGQVYYLNPTELVQQRGSASRSFRARFKLTEKYRILAIAVHEFVHGAYGINRHDEDYANTLTEVMALVLKERQRFAKCFVSLACWMI